MPDGHKRYPLSMKHPGFKPAVLSGVEPDPDHPGLMRNQPPGRPDQFPPVVVQNLDQEQDYAARGYVPPGVVDTEAYRLEMCELPNPNAPKQVDDFPKWLYHAVKGQDEVESLLVKDLNEEKALGALWRPTPDLARAALKAKPKGPEPDSPDAEAKPKGPRPETTEAVAPKKRYTMSAAAKAKISAGVKRRNAEKKAALAH